MKTKVRILASVLLISQVSAIFADNLPQSRLGGSLTPQSQSRLLKTSHFLSDNAQMLPEDNVNLWNTINQGFKIKTSDNPQIHAEIRRLLKNKSYLHEVTSQAEPYMYWIVEQLQKRNMPTELVLLPVVESAFNPMATSNRDAAGIWQIISSTGKHYGLKQNQWYDGRRDLVASTRVALNMLQRLNRMFDGDWLLTVAAYNSGEGRVLNAIKKNRAQGKPTDFWHLALPKETTSYIPKMLALRDIIQNYRRYGFHLPTPNQQHALARVEVGKAVKLTQVAAMTGMPVKRLQKFNAGYKKGMTLTQGTQYVMIPKSHVEKLKLSLANYDLQNASPADLRDTGLIAHYTVKKGDSLSTIAQRYGVSVQQIKSMNNIHNQKIKIGQRLAFNKTHASTQDNESIRYQIQKGDSLSSIAKRHGVKIKDVMRWNQLRNAQTTLLPGQNITLFVNNS